MSGEDLAAFEQAARGFAARHVAPMVGTEGRDGDLGRLAEVLEAAETAGLLARASADSPGRELGIWGRACLEQGPAASLAMLSEVARACAGVAGCLHAAGLGALELADRADEPLRPAVAFFEPGWRCDAEALSRPPDTACRLHEASGIWAISGDKTFVRDAPGWDALVVYASGPRGWERAIVRRDAPGVRVEPSGDRIGLAALETVHVRLEAAPIEGPPLRPVDPGSFVTRWLFGLAAVALGNAAAALEAAQAYASERRQGGSAIERHAAVRLLIGEAASRVVACEAVVRGAGRCGLDGGEALSRAAGAKLRVADDGCRAVSDCLQVLGGYGYMEDYRMEKRLRDALELEAMALRPDDLRQMCAEPLAARAQP